MAKFHGEVGFVVSEETSPGVYTDSIITREYKGDLLRNNQKWEASEYQGEDININNRFSIVADPFIYENIERIRYILWNNTKWKVNTTDIQRPRLILHVRGVYNG